MTTSAGARVLADATRLVVRGWCQQADARNADGDQVEPWDPQATSWSLLGAIVSVLEAEARDHGEVPLEELAAALYAIADVIEVDSLTQWNDAPERTHHEVVSMLEAAETAFERPST